MASPFVESVARAAATEATRQNQEQAAVIPLSSAIRTEGGPSAFAKGAAMDWTTTAMALQHPGLQESNPMINWMPTTAGKIAVGAGIDAGTYFALKHLLKDHPTLFNIGSVVAGGLRGALAMRNLHQMQKINDR